VPVSITDNAQTHSQSQNDSEVPVRKFSKFDPDETAYLERL